MANRHIAVHESVTVDRIVELVQQGDNCGLCLECGEEAFGVEPDARRYPCESCGAQRVYGAEQLLITVVP